MFVSVCCFVARQCVPHNLMSCWLLLLLQVSSDSFIFYPLPCPGGYILQPSDGVQGSMVCRCQDNVTQVINCEDDQDTIVIEVCMCVCVCVCVRAHVCACACVCARVCVCVCACVHMYVCAHVHVCSCVSVCMCVYVCVLYACVWYVCISATESMYLNSLRSV